MRRHTVFDYFSLAVVAHFIVFGRFNALAQTGRIPVGIFLRPPSLPTHKPPQMFLYCAFYYVSERAVLGAKRRIQGVTQVCLQANHNDTGICDQNTVVIDIGHFAEGCSVRVRHTKTPRNKVDFCHAQIGVNFPYKLANAAEGISRWTKSVKRNQDPSPVVAGENIMGARS